MTDLKPTLSYQERRNEEAFDLGGLRFVVCSMDYGANLAVFADLGKGWVEIIRFQDYADDPHYHAPIGGWYNFDRAELGEPLGWWMTQLRDHLAEWLEECSFGALVETIDLDAVGANLDRVDQLRSHLRELLGSRGYAQLIPTLDFDAITSGADELYAAMYQRVPLGCARVPGFGLQRVGQA